MFELKPVLLHIVVDGELEADKLPSTRQWEFLKAVTAVLQPFKKAQKFLEGEKYVTASVVPGMVLRCREALEKSKEGGEVAASKLSGIMLADFESRWGKKTEPVWSANGSHGMKRGHKNRHVGVHPVFVIAAALDPRFKNAVFPLRGQGGGLNFDNNSLEKIETEIIDLLVNAKEIDMVAMNNIVGNEGVAQGVGGGKDDDSFMDFDDEATASPLDGTNPKLECKQEWDRFKETPGIRSKDCPLDWWRDRKEKFPTIAFLARQFLAAQATSAPTERIFSRASRIISQLRTRLDPTIASQTHFVAENIDWFYAELEKEGATESDTNQQK